ncbi:RING finger protein nhl-1 [Sergentomyia squamirostris]
MYHKNPPVILRTKSMRLQDRGSLAPIEDLVLCAICSDRLQNPKMLACQHTFCSGCLEAIFANVTKKECPTCKATFEGDLGDLPTNLYMVSLLKVLESNPEGQTMSMIMEERCVKCEMVPNTGIDCDQFFRNCSHCRQKFCQICWTSHMSDLTSQLVNLSDQLKSAEECLTHKLDHIKDRVDQMKTHIGQFVVRQVQELKQKEINAIESAEQMVDDAAAKYKVIVNAIESTKRDLSGKLSRLEPDQEASAYFLQMHKKISEILQDISKWDDVRIIFNEEDFKVEINSPESGEQEGEDDSTEQEDNNPLEDKTTMIRHIITTKFKSRLFWAKCTRPLGVALAPWVDEIAGEPLIYIAGSESKIIFAIERKRGRIIHRIFHEDMLYPHSIAISSDSQEIFVSDKWKHCVFVFSRHGELQRVIGSKGDLEGSLRSPEGIALGSDQTIYICDTGNDRVQCLNQITGQMIMQFGQIKKTQLISSAVQGTRAKMADLQSPTSIALRGSNIVVLDSGHCRVKIFNNLGEKVCEFGKMGTHKGQFKYPEVLTVGPHGFIFLGDSGNARVQIFTKDGRLIKTIGGRGSSSGYFKWISGIHVTKDLEIIVSDYKNHSVQIFQ